jgi:YkoY family integral membrane protein
MFHQTFQPRDLLVVAILVVLEVILSVDNALVLGLLAGKLAPGLQRKALMYGLIGAFVFRLIAIAGAARLLEWHFIKLLGGGYLAYVALKHLLMHRPKGTATDVARKTFWQTVAAIELTDMAFAVDSILAAIALVGPAPLGSGTLHPKFWVIVLGGMLGVIFMRVAAVVFIRLLKKFPRFETSAYLLVLVIGLKLLANWWNPDINFQSPASSAFWGFWAVMAVCLAVGFLPSGEKSDWRDSGASG